MPSGQPSPASPSGSSSSSMTASYLSVPIPGNRMSRPTAMVVLLIVLIEECKDLKTNALSPWRKWASSSGAPRRGRGAWAPRRGRPAGPVAAIGTALEPVNGSAAPPPPSVVVVVVPPAPPPPPPPDIVVVVVVELISQGFTQNTLCLVSLPFDPSAWTVSFTCTPCLKCGVIPLRS